MVKASDDDVAWLHPEADPVDVARSWVADHGLALVLITCGARGAVAVTPDGPPLRVPGFEVTVADTVGAGDTFTGGAAARPRRPRRPAGGPGHVLPGRRPRRGAALRGGRRRDHLHP